jgi:trehalose monomycolate/heme transporter
MHNKLASTALSRPRTVLAIWLLVALVSVLIARSGLGNVAEQGYSVPGSETARVGEILDRYVTGNVGTPIYAVLSANRPPPPVPWTSAVESRLSQQRFHDIDQAIGRLQKLRHMASAESLATESELVNKSTAHGALLAIVSMRLDLSYAAAEGRVPAIEAALRKESRNDISFGLLGGVVSSRGYSMIVRQDLTRAEQYALPVIFAALLVAFLSLVAAVLPVFTAAITLFVTLTFIHLVSLCFGLSPFVINTASAVALGLSIDYALFIVTRFREERQTAASIDQAILRTMRTAGRAVTLSGLTIAASLSALLLVGVGLFSSIAVGGIIASLISVLASITLLPATIRLLGDRLNRFTLTPVAQAARRGTFWRRLAQVVTTHPIASALASLTVLLVLAVPSLSLQLDFRNIGALPSHDTETRELKRLAKVFGPGAGGLVEIVTQSPGGVSRVLHSDPDEREIFRIVEGIDGWDDLDVVLKTSPDSNASHNTIIRLRRELHNSEGTTLVGGLTAGEIDLTARVASRMLIVAALAMIIGLIMLTTGLRSIVIPLKAVLCSALSVAATIGVLLVCFPSTGAGSSLAFFVPLVVFVLVFGLSVDYEVFLLSRVKEAIDAGNPVTAAVSIGLARSARPITLAALTVAIVFAVFLFSSLEAIQQLGIGVAIAVILDVSIVRCVLVPACIVLLGRWNWWFPKRLERNYAKTSFHG